MDKRFYEQCEQEKLHLSGRIQPHGLLVVLNHELIVTHVSGNAAKLLNIGIANLIGQPMPEALTFLTNDLPDKAGERSFSHCHVDDQELDVVLIRSADGFLVELYPVDTDLAAAPALPALPSVFADTHERNYYRQELLGWIARVSGHDRVMYYQFLEDGDGHVSAEVCSENIQGSYLDLRFPASDIPQIARKIYILNPWREIVSAASDSIPLYGEEGVPDLTFSDLRSVSPVHLQYMSNMGVASSVSFPIVKGDELDALISCHSPSARKLPQPVLQQIARAIATYTLLDKELDARNRLNFIDEFNFQISAISSLINSGEPLQQIWAELASAIADYFSVDGVALCIGDTVFASGLTFDADTLELVDDWFVQYEDGFVFHTDSIQRFMDEPLLTEIAGFGCLKFRSEKHHKMNVRLYLTRQEYIHEVSWGGNPDKPAEALNDQIPVSPRRSFSRWVEKRLGYSKAWSETTTLQLHRFRSLLEQSGLLELL